MDERIPKPVRPILEYYQQLMETRLAGFVEALYLYGSIALGAFNTRLSDVDFVAVVGHRPDEQEIEQLRVAHQLVRQQHPQPKLAGIYLPWEDLGRPPGEITPYPCYHGSVLNPQGFFELNPVTWWILKKRAVTVFGPPAETLPYSVDSDWLLGWTRQNLNSFWASYTRRPSRIAALLTDWGIEWTVLGVLRQFYTLREHDITSKTGAGQYALSCLPGRWHRLIQEAIRIRGDNHSSLFKSRLWRAREAFVFLKHVIAAGNSFGD